MYYTLKDHQGSLAAAVHGSAVERLSYDPWGRRRNTTNFGYGNASHTFDRGFTGHEHYDFMHLINSNARIYDPVIGHFFSPDPFVQTPDFTQSYNRYSYCLNNPVMYSDPDGEFVGTVLGFISDLINNVFIKPFKGEGPNWEQTVHGWEIDMGLLETDPNKSGWGRFWEVVSRFTWQVPQTSTGHLFVSVANAFEHVNGVTYGYGVTAVDMGLDKGAVTIGNYSSGPDGYKADWRDHLFVHEYGHYIQSQQCGPLYFPSVAVPSLQSAILQTKNPNSPRHKDRWFEADASYKGADYFDKYYGSGKEGYVAESTNFFDRNSFIYKYKSPYINPRTDIPYQNPHPITGKFHWTDIPINIPLLGLLPYLLYL
ncbi:MAG: RHS repeat-associated core domain-containing protein [Bacteroidales bacterium]|nr:RHS repeat-associated core domain-containing protein [Bacteroidales bacterium]